MSRRSLPLLLCGLLLAAGCSGEAEPEGGSFVVTDSAGVTIARSSRPAWGPGDSWQVSTRPLLLIGVESGEAPYLFARVAGALRLPDGGVVVADGRSRELRYFDEEGSFLFSAGGPGDGPGELPVLYSLARCGEDALHAFDHRRRARIFDPSGTWLRTLPQIMTPAGGPPQDLSCGEGGRFLVVGWDPGQLRRMEGYYRVEVPVRIHDEEGVIVTELGTFAAHEYIGEPGGAAPHVFTHRLVHALDGDHAYVGTGDAHALRRFGPSGTLERVIRWEGPDLSFTDADLERYEARRRADAAPARRADVERELRDWIRPDRWPAYRSLRVDPEGYLWVEDYPRTAGERTGSRWTLLSPEGEWLGTVRTPPGLRVTDIGSDYVLGVLEDDLGVERVALYGLRR